MSVIHEEGSSESLGRLSRELAAAAERARLGRAVDLDAHWAGLTLGEMAGWHAYTSAFLAALRGRWRGHPC